ncbi:hypothetical protein KY284_020378 [Solanum tuberosum]|nr:hypothetical protein KY284_020378 [Solanum tuberosum]
MLWGGIDIPEGPSSNIPIIFYIHPNLVTGDVAIVEDDGETDAEETDEAELEAHDEVVYYSLEGLDGAIVQMVMEASLHDTSMIGSSGSQPTKENIAQLFKVGD